MQRFANQLREYMDRNGLSQAELADKAHVSQATVSRALAGKVTRRGAAKLRLFSYAGITEYNESEDRGDSRTKVIDTFERVWDRSAAHAEAIAKVIEALADLEPRKKRTDL